LLHFSQKSPTLLIFYQTEQEVRLGAERGVRVHAASPFAKTERSKFARVSLPSGIEAA
jgi:hypothetical protein